MKPGPVIPGLEDHLAMCRTCRSAGPTNRRPYFVDPAHTFLKKDAGQLMPHHSNFVRADSIDAFQNFVDSVGNLFFLLSREGLLYMMPHKQGLRRRHHRQVKTAVMASRLAIKGLRQRLEGHKFLDGGVRPAQLLRC